MSVEIHHALKLEEAWKRDDTRVCYELLSSIPDGVVFRAGDLILQMAESLPEEKELMELSVKEKREFALIKTADKKEIVEGSETTTDMDDIAGALHKIATHDEEPIVFSHMHWNVNEHPLPGHAVIGFGDIGVFDFFMSMYPLLECRVTFNQGHGVRSIVYKGKIKNSSELAD